MRPQPELRSIIIAIQSRALACMVALQCLDYLSKRIKREFKNKNTIPF
jgi:hypothetical protein